MKFGRSKRRQPPTVIIVSLIDVLLVVLIFLMVTTSFKQTPSIKLALPESKQGEKGTSDSSLVVTVAKTEPFFFLGKSPMTLDRLQSELSSNAQQNPNLS